MPSRRLPSTSCTIRRVTGAFTLSCLAALAHAQSRPDTIRKDSLTSQRPITTAKSAIPGEQLIRAIHDRYTTNWFKTLTAVQTTTQTRKDGTTNTTTWYQSVSLPGKMRIDIGAPSAGNGALYTADSTYRLQNGAVIVAINRINELMPLMFDVFAVPAERTVASLRKIGFDLRITHEGRWHGRPVIVVGAPPNTLTRPQFWIDKERLVLVRQLQPIAPGDPRLLDIQLSRYQQVDSSWHPNVIEIYIDGVLTQHEVYSDIKINPPLANELFDVSKWMTVKHWAVPATEPKPKSIPPIKR